MLITSSAIANDSCLALAHDQDEANVRQTVDAWAHTVRIRPDPLVPPDPCAKTTFIKGLIAQLYDQKHNSTQAVRWYRAAIEQLRSGDYSFYRMRSPQLSDEQIRKIAQADMSGFELSIKTLTDRDAQLKRDEEVAAQKRAQEQAAREAALKPFMDSFERRKDIGDYVCWGTTSYDAYGDQAGYVEAVHDDKIQIRAKQFGGFRNVIAQDIIWLKYNDVGVCPVH